MARSPNLLSSVRIINFTFQKRTLLLERLSRVAFQRSPWSLAMTVGLLSINCRTSQMGHLQLILQQSVTVLSGKLADPADFNASFVEGKQFHNKFLPSAHHENTFT